MTTHDGPGPYRPIACDQHSLLELLAMHRAPVRVEARDADGAVTVFDGVVADVLTREGAEYLVVRDPSFGRREVRLDCLLRLHDERGALLWRQ